MDDPFPKGMLQDIENFLKNDHERSPGLDVYPEVFQTELFFPLQRQRELAEMMRIARNVKPKVVYEIGTDKGGGLYHWCKCLPTVSRVVACEVRGTPYRHLFEKAFPHIDFLWIENSSYSTKSLGTIHDWLGEDKLDIVFIDGDKSAFEKDFACILPWVSSTHPVIFMHDITDPSPGVAFDRVVNKFACRHQKIVDKRDSDEAVSREREGIPSTGSHEGWLRHWKGSSCGVGVIYL